jgi:hypothetical protein
MMKEKVWNKRYYKGNQRSKEEIYRRWKKIEEKWKVKSEMRGKEGGKTEPGGQVRRCSSEACNHPVTWNKNDFTIWSQLRYALLTHFNIMIGRFKNAFLVACSVCRGDGPTGGRPPAARPHVLAGQRLRITSNCYSPQRETSHRNHSLEEE